jgi:hypothetical protein
MPASNETGAGRVLFEHHDQRTIEQRMVRFVILEFALDDSGTFNHVLEFSKRKVRKLEEVFDCHK